MEHTEVRLDAWRKGPDCRPVPRSELVEAALLNVYEHWYVDRPPLVLSSLIATKLNNV